MSYDKTASEYNEILCQAVDNMITTRLQDVKFDQTIVCTIVDNSNKNKGYYTVNNGSLTFEAYSDNVNYLTNQQVYVLIPQGDYSNQKTIVNKYNAESNKATEFTNPTDIVVPITTLYKVDVSQGNEVELYLGNNYSENKVHPTSTQKVNESIILHTNPQNASTVPVYFQQNLNLPVKNYDSLVIEAEFYCNAMEGGWTMNTGTYGLGVAIQTANRGKMEQLTIDLDARKDMLGNPLQFLGGWFKQNVKSTGLQNLNQDDVITSIRIDLYENGGFAKQGGTGTGENVLQVGVRNIQVYLGKDITNMDTTELPKLEISTNDYSSYTNSSATRQLQAIWYNVKNNKYEGISQIISNLEWQQWAQDDWFTLSIQDIDKITPVVQLDKQASQTRFRAVYKVGAEEVAISNILTFHNADTEWLLDETNAFQLVHGVNSQSGYPYYDENNELTASEFYKARELKVEFNPQFVENRNTVQGKIIEWRIPKQNSMLNINLAELTKPHKLDEQQSFQVFTDMEPDNAEYYILQGKWEELTDSDGKKYNATSLFYSIKNFYNDNLLNNTIECYIYYDKIHTKKVTQHFTFASKGIAGTQYTLTITPDNGLGWIQSIAKNDADYQVVYEAKLFSPTGEDITSQITEWKWSPRLNKNEFSGESDGNKYSIRASTLEKPELLLNTYHHNNLTVSVNIDNALTLQKTVPIIWAENNYFTTVPSVLTYDYAGNLITNIAGELKLYNRYTNEEITTEPSQWYLYIFSQDPDSNSRYSISTSAVYTDYDKNNLANKIQFYAPNLTSDGKFMPSKTFSSQMAEQCFMVLSAFKKNNEGVMWSQPILVQFDQYASNVLNNWDGKLIADNDSNMILSAMMAAGTKNGNKFTGVLMGNIGKSDGIIGSGLLGLKDGIQTFNLSTSGDLILGAAGQGQIHFDGERGIIKANNENDFSINLSTGVLKSSKFSLLADNNGNKIIIDNQNEAKPYFHIGNTQEYIKFDKKGKLKIKVDELEITNGEAGVNLLNGTSTASLENIRKEGWWGSVTSNNKGTYTLSLNQFNAPNEAENRTSYTAWVLMSYDLSRLSQKIHNKTVTLSGQFKLIRPNDVKLTEEDASSASFTFGFGSLNNKNSNYPIWGPCDTIQKASLWQSLKTSTNFSKTFNLKNEPYLTFLFTWAWNKELDKSTPKHMKLEISNLKLEIGENENPSWSPAPGDVIVNDYFGLSNKSQGIYMENGLLGINASYIKTGTLASANGKIQWNLNSTDEENLILAENAHFVNSPSFSLGAEGLMIKQDTNALGGLTSAKLFYQTNNYSVEGNASEETVDYYYYETTARLSDIRIRLNSDSMTSTSSGSPQFNTEKNKTYRLECDKDGKLKRVSRYESSECFIVRFPDNANTYYVSSSFQTSSNRTFNSIPSGTPIQEAKKIENATKYTGAYLSLPNNNSGPYEIILSDNQGKWIKITGSGITTSSNYTTPWS